MTGNVTKLLLHLEGYPHPNPISPWKTFLSPNRSWIEPKYLLLFEPKNLLKKKKKRREERTHVEKAQGRARQPELTRQMAAASPPALLPGRTKPSLITGHMQMAVAFPQLRPLASSGHPQPAAPTQQQAGAEGL